MNPKSLANLRPADGAHNPNPRGRPKGGAGAAKEIRRRFGEDIAGLIDFAERALADPTCPWPTKQAMHHWLADRAIGKPLTQVEVDVTAHTAERTALPANWDSLSVLERDRWIDMAFPAPTAADPLADRLLAEALVTEAVE